MYHVTMATIAVDRISAQMLNSKLHCRLGTFLVGGTVAVALFFQHFDYIVTINYKP